MQITVAQAGLRYGRLVKVDHVAAHRPIVSCSISEDGRWAAIATPRYDASSDTRPLEVAVRALDDRDPDSPWHWLVPPGDARPAVFDPTFAPDCVRVAAMTSLAGEPAGLIWRLDDLSTEPLAVTGLPPLARTFKWRGRPGLLSCLGTDADGWRRVWSWSDHGEAPRPVTPEGLHAGDFAWRPDGAALAWLHLPDLSEPASERLPIHLSDPSTGESADLRVPGRPVGYLAWSPDGRRLAYVARRAGQRLSRADLWVVDPSRWPGHADGARCLTRDLDAWLTGFDWSHDGSELILAVVEGTSGRLYRIGLDGSRSPLGPRATYLSGPHSDRRTGRLLHLHQDGDTPQRLCLREPDGESVRVLTSLNDGLEETGLRPVETVRWTATDGTTLDGLMVRPDDGTAGAAPLLVWVHGGPAEVMARTFSTYFQVFAAAGWAVFAPNYRGSTGRSEEFLRANVGDLVGADVDDVLTGMDRLVQMGVANADQAALVGWSYGGTLALGAARRSGAVRAVVAGAPVVDWVSFFGAPRLPALYRDYFPSPPWEDRAPFDAASPITWVADIDVPVLLLHGTLDPIVPPSQSRLLYRALKALGCDTDLMLYPGEGHVLSRPSAVADMLQRVLDWVTSRAI